MRVVLLLLLVLLPVVLAGCSMPPPAPNAPAASYREMGFDGETWPRLDGVTLVVLDHGAFFAFDDAARLFENKTGARVEHVSADDSGSMLSRAAREKGDPSFDVIYGIDNILWTQAVGEGVFTPYEPLLASRIDPAYRFAQTWHATPVDHGYIAVNVDETKLGARVASLEELEAQAAQFVTQDPRTSTPGLGYLLATIATYGEPAWKEHWRSLFEGGVLVTSGWTEAYEQHFSAGYNSEAGLADRAIVTSYTTSPAYEAYYGREPSALASVLTAPNATFRQVQTMGIANGTTKLAAAQAWIEFTLTDEFQALAAPGNAVYPVVASVETDSTYGAHDPEPGSFAPAPLDSATIGANLERWLREWTDLCEQHDCA
jgi:thiamine transport system substrate-binding protein